MDCPLVDNVMSVVGEKIKFSKIVLVGIPEVRNILQLLYNGHIASVKSQCDASNDSGKCLSGEIIINIADNAPYLRLATQQHAEIGGGP
jgi:hypothetical protein